MVMHAARYPAEIRLEFRGETRTHDRCSDRSPLHDVRQHVSARTEIQHGDEDVLADERRPGWWSQTGSNRRPPACKAGALPTELWPRGRNARLSCTPGKLRTRENLVGLGRLELPTSRLSSARSNQLSYKPLIVTNGRHARDATASAQCGTGSSAERKRSVDGGVPPIGP
jgi:hypothetical protein